MPFPRKYNTIQICSHLYSVSGLFKKNKNKHNWQALAGRAGPRDAEDHHAVRLLLHHHDVYNDIAESEEAISEIKEFSRGRLVAAKRRGNTFAVG